MGKNVFYARDGADASEANVPGKNSEEKFGRQLSGEKFGREIRKRNSEDKCRVRKFGREIRKRNSEETCRVRNSEEKFGREIRKRNVG